MDYGLFINQLIQDSDRAPAPGPGFGSGPGPGTINQDLGPAPGPGLTRDSGPAPGTHALGRPKADRGPLRLENECMGMY